MRIKTVEVPCRGRGAYELQAEARLKDFSG